MPKITYVAHTGVRHTLEAAEGQTVMEAAVRNNIPGIDADCGGACACATCHVYVDEAWATKTGTPNAMELSMLEFAEDARSTSRLACQIRLAADLDGLIVHTPESQH